MNVIGQEAMNATLLIPAVLTAVVAAAGAAGAVALGSRAARGLVRTGSVPNRSGGSAHRGSPRPARDGAAVGELAERLAARLRAGASLPEALGAVRGAGVLEADLATLRSRLRRGDPLDSALVAFGGCGDEERALLVAALRMAARHGGRTADALDGVAGTLRDRRAVAAELAAQTSQARLSAWVLVALPPLFLMLGSLVDRRLVGALSTPAGLAALVVAGLFELGGWAWIRRILASGARAVGAS